MHLDLECVESFMTLAAERHYGRAAAALHITSPTLTKRIQRLERQLQVRLLERDQGGVLALTQAGEQLAVDAGPLLEHERAARRAVQRKTITVTLGLAGDGDTQGVTTRELLGVRRLLSLEHPGVVLVCRKTPLPMQTMWLLEGRVDVQLTAAAVQHRTVQSTAVATVPRIAAVPLGSELGDAQQVQVEDLLHLPMLHDPHLPEELMRPFWLGDIRPAAHARLVSVSAATGGAVLEHVRRSTGMTVLVGAGSRGAPAGVHLLPMAGAPPLVLYAARRTLDHRPLVQSLVDALHAVPPVRPQMPGT